ncbi:hypothetical protein H4O18_05305 [Arenibacter sp. BSSL-BM3]|uniref:Uncharacterized protein n=1 Tax=Arenibacter arenosicollis TaxID=2762274 RepID=A0ABR7QKA8_9FLAO|nr:DUF6503 family protein [Arenibacter arenosicollis]MBC8767402.1 hypothetical protein [Arenibacter arenosicollis]
MKYLFLLIFFAATACCMGQNLTGSELLEKAIAYHDPNGNWNSFKGVFTVSMEPPKGDKRISYIAIDLPACEFKLTTNKEGTVIVQTMDKGDCLLTLNGNEDISDADKAAHNISCERTKMMKDYYTYLYGLPMKLKDPGTIIESRVEPKTFKNKEYLRLKVTYTEEVGTDTWYFYFDPTTYAMEIYQFFHNESKNGEYILLSGEEIISGIKMPKTRAWYYHKNDQYLGTDVLDKNSN